MNKNNLNLKTGSFLMEEVIQNTYSWFVKWTLATLILKLLLAPVQFRDTFKVIKKHTYSRWKIFLISIQSLTLIHEPHPLWNTCLLNHDIKATQEYAYLLAFFIIIGNSLLVDVICFSRIFNYMRKNSVRVSVIAGKYLFLFIPPVQWWQNLSSQVVAKELHIHLSWDTHT